MDRKGTFYGLRVINISISYVIVQYLLLKLDKHNHGSEQFTTQYFKNIRTERLNYCELITILIYTCLVFYFTMI